jgi:hypothetical protein
VCRRDIDFCRCPTLEEDAAFRAMERAYWGDDEPTGQYVWSPTERQLAEDREREQDTSTRRDE